MSTGPATSARPAVGDRFTLVKDPVTTVQLVMYAGASGDFNRIHYDLPYAEEAGLGGVIAHGMLTMGFAAQAVTDWAGPGAVVRDLSARFLIPVRPGDRVTVEGRVEEVREEDGSLVVGIGFDATTASGRVAAGSGIVVRPTR